MIIFGRIYRITNKVNGKIYIGCTKTTITKRWNKHLNEVGKNRRKNHLYESIRKYGKESFYVDEICVCMDKESLCAAETDLIKVYGSFNNSKGYNLTMGGEGLVGYKWNDTQRKEASIRNRGEKASASKLTEKDIYAIHEHLKTKNNKQVAQIYGVSKETIRCIIVGKSWNWLGLDFSKVGYKSKTSSHQRGVSLHKPSGKWRIFIKGTDYGLYKTEKEAIAKAQLVIIRNAPSPI